MQKNSSLAAIFMGLVVLGGGFFALDYYSNGYDKKAGEQASQASLLQLQIGEKNGGDTQTFSIDTANNAVVASTETAPVATEPEVKSLTAENIFTVENLAKAGYTTGNVADLKNSSRLFDFFDLKELKDSQLTKQSLSVDGKILAYLYQFPAESYALGLDYEKTKSQVAATLSPEYVIKSPSSFSANSFYIVPKDFNGQGKITAVAQINNTLYGFEYKASDFQTLKTLIDSLDNIQE